mmetsp:Transcript_1344/g.4008  ORF Transcript_1344/g.4008 Transcript_1344/m.4008 type:complete len:762 (-) Transcript_1344:362-2647(-)
MRFQLDDLDVFFPYPSLYPEQFAYMSELKKALDAEGHALLEMPTGTGKTACLLALITAFQYAHPEMGKLIYCTRTVPEMEKCLQELKRLWKYRAEERGPDASKSPFLALCLSSRRNMCVHERVVTQADRDAVDVECRKMTASWVRLKAEKDNSTELCDFYEAYDRAGTDAAVPDGIYDVEDLKRLGRKAGWCPYFVARHAITHASVIVYNYQYMLDPKVAGMVTRELEKESVVVFDEAHNIDNICIEALSVELHRNKLDAAQRCVTRLERKVSQLRESDQARVRDEYDKLVRGLGLAPPADANAADEPAAAAAALPEDLLQEAVPGNVRRAESFLQLLKKFTEHLSKRLRATRVEVESPAAFLLGLEEAHLIDAKPLKFFHSRLNQLLRTLQAPHMEDVQALAEVAAFAANVSTYAEGFSVVVDPIRRGSAGIPEPQLDLACLDASLAFKPVIERFRSVVITSGTLSPLDLYPKLLNFAPVVRCSFPMSIFRPCILPLVVTRGADQQEVSTRFQSREDPSVVRNYGSLLLAVCEAVPDGVVAFFTSYSYMERVISAWDEAGLLRRVLRHKLLFIETKDVVETSLALENFHRACDAGRGAVFLSIARGKVAEGIDFEHHYGRCVLNIGVPFQYTQSHVLRTRLEFLRSKYDVSEANFLNFDALRQTAQCVGRVVRSKTDYGIVLLADVRFARHDKRSKLPGWVQQFIGDANLNLSTEAAIGVMRTFLKQMAQPVDDRDLKQMLVDRPKLDVLLAERKREGLR